MAANNNPIFSKVGDIQGTVFLNTAAADYTGQNINNQVVFVSDLTNGGFIQRLRFKSGSAANTDAKVARIYINDGGGALASVASTAQQPSGTPSSSGGTLLAGTYFAKVQAVDQYGSPTSLSTESASVTTTGSTGSISWTWTASTSAASYVLWVGSLTGAQQTYFITSNNTFNQTVPYISGQLASPNNNLSNNVLYGELSLPITTLSTTASTTELDYPLNIALPPGYRILVGLGAFTAGGWYCSAIGGKY